MTRSILKITVYVQVNTDIERWVCYHDSAESVTNLKPELFDKFCLVLKWAKVWENRSLEILKVNVEVRMNEWMNEYWVGQTRPYIVPISSLLCVTLEHHTLNEAQYKVKGKVVPTLNSAPCH
jgi:hypothetical protein